MTSVKITDILYVKITGFIMNITVNEKTCGNCKYFIRHYANRNGLFKNLYVGTAYTNLILIKEINIFATATAANCGKITLKLSLIREKI